LFGNDLSLCCSPEETASIGYSSEQGPRLSNSCHQMGQSNTENRREYHASEHVRRRENISEINAVDHLSTVRRYAPQLAKNVPPRHEQVIDEEGALRAWLDNRLDIDCDGNLLHQGSRTRPIDDFNVGVYDKIVVELALTELRDSAA
jgi:hypothetical protein